MSIFRSGNLLEILYNEYDEQLEVTMTKKTAPAKKTKAVNKPVKKATFDSEQEALAKELKSLIPQIDSEGLSFLVQQARVHIYNMKVDELNNAASEVHSASIRSQSKTNAGKSSSKKEKFTFNATSAGYYMRYGGSGIMFSKTEMARLVKIVHSSTNDASGRLYTWFEQERRDVLSTISIADKFDERLKNMASVIKKNFKLQ